MQPSAAAAGLRTVALCSASAVYLRCFKQEDQDAVVDRTRLSLVDRRGTHVGMAVRGRRRQALGVTVRPRLPVPASW